MTSSGRFILPQAKIDGMTHATTSRPGGIFDLRHQFGPNPLDGTVERIAGDEQICGWLPILAAPAAAEGQ